MPAASWVNSLSACEISEELARSLDFLLADSRDVPDRQRSLRAAFEHSWRRLGEDERAVFARLCVCRGGFTRQAAQAIALATARQLTALVSKSFINWESTSGRYQVHEILRQYGEEALLAAGDADVTRERHAEYLERFLITQEAVLQGPTQRDGVRAIEVEIGNVRAATDWICASGACFIDDGEGANAFADAGLGSASRGSGSGGSGSGGSGSGGQAAYAGENFPPPPPPAVCGDGQIGIQEGCDDSNGSSGDGCDAGCRVEPGWTCSPAAGCISTYGDRACSADACSHAATCIERGTGLNCLCPSVMPAACENLRFRALGLLTASDSCSSADLSSDGTTVVGTCSRYEDYVGIARTWAFRWSASTGPRRRRRSHGRYHRHAGHDRPGRAAARPARDLAHLLPHAGRHHASAVRGAASDGGRRAGSSTISSLACPEVGSALHARMARYTTCAMSAHGCARR